MFYKKFYAKYKNIFPIKNVLHMCDKNKIQQILRYVWLPICISSNEKLPYITDLICEILEDYGELSDLSDLLNEISLKEYGGSISSEKSLEAAKLIMSWYGGPLLRTDYAVMRFNQSMYYTFLSYKNSEKELKLTFNMTINHEVIVDPNKLLVDGEEKQQLLKVMQEIYEDNLIIDNEENSEYITNNLAYW